MVRQNLAGVEFNQLQVENDTLALQAAAFNGGPGIVLIGGTGSNCCAIDVNGQVQVAGGQDFIWGDPGSAYHIGYLAIERVMAALDGREVAAPKLTQLVLDYMKINPAAVDVYGQMSKWTYRDRKIKERISALASLVANLANDGDVEARAIFYASMAAAVEFVQAVVRRAGFSAHGLRIGITGGAITGQPGRRILDELLQVALPGTTTFIPQLPPAVGALWRALQMSDVPVTEKIIASLATALTAAPILQTPPRRSTL
jgi:N-acetylglucosamine kinase-like BadF-type ATPase